MAVTGVNTGQKTGQNLPLCPRCGAPYRGLHYKEVNGRTYIYAYHGKQGKKPVLCYLGPADGYIAVEQLFALGLTNAESVDLVQVAYSAASLFQIRARRASPDERKAAAEKLRQLAEDILHLAQDLEK
jgi:hypothetical protein